VEARHYQSYGTAALRSMLRQRDVHAFLRRPRRLQQPGPFFGCEPHAVFGTTEPAIAVVGYRCVDGIAPPLWDQRTEAQHMPGTADDGAEFQTAAQSGKRSTIGDQQVALRLARRTRNNACRSSDVMIRRTSAPQRPGSEMKQLAHTNASSQFQASRRRGSTRLRSAAARSPENRRESCGKVRAAGSRLKPVRD
jgi:hypothetical protein